MNDPVSSFASFCNGEAVSLKQVPLLPVEDFQSAIVRAAQEGLRIASYFAMAESAESPVRLVAVLADDLNGQLLAAIAEVRGPSLPSLTPACPQVHLFEREIREQFRLDFIDHPWMKPVRFSAPMRAPRGGLAAAGAKPLIGVTDFYRLEGEEVHEVGVGPVHAGVIEPGHFRFQCHGEHVFHLEISLGYQHRGIEEAVIGGPHPITIHQMETAAGDTTIGHAWAYCQNLEALGGTPVSARAHVVRALALEFERLANHTGDLGALAADVGYLPTASFCGRIRGDFLNMTASLCGNRFGRSLMRPGGVRFGLAPAEAQDLIGRVKAAREDVTRAVDLLWQSPSVLARFENTGAVGREDCIAMGFVGPAARACGVERDVRNDHPTGVYRFSHIPVATAQDGDVYSRAFVRWLEIQRSLEFVEERLGSLPEESPGEAGAPAPECLAVSLIEGWRGEVCHVAVTDAAGKFARYKVTDPSFHNWSALALALRDQQISDFPLCNKSFNLSYCGHDL